MPTRDATIAARVPSDLRDDLERACRQAGDVNLTATIRRMLRAACDAELKPLSDTGATSMLPFAADSSTSRNAALDAYPRQGTQRARIIDQLDGIPLGMTRDELAARLGMSPNTVRPRIVELMEGGWVEDTGRTRKTPLKRDAEVLALTDKARRELRARRSNAA